VAAGVAARAHEAVGEHAATKVSAELLLYVARHLGLVNIAGVREKCLQVAAYDAVEHRLGGAARPVCRCKEGR